ncbi:MAG: AMP-binding protein [Candidatus Thermoplasmatota archaeon]|nr:AMP-binding protein [Candidatus Thermoplasmatota archaeon]
MLNISEAVSRASQKWPEKAFLIFDNQEITFKDFRENVNRWTDYLSKNKIEKSDIVSVYSKNNTDMLYLWMASNRLGAIFAPFNFNLRDTELEKLVQDSKPRLLFTDADLKSGNLEKITKVVKFDTITLSGSSKSLEFTEPDDVSTLLYTSGTESLPKGVMNTHINWTAALLSSVVDLNWKHDDVFLLSIPLYHVAGLYTFIGFLNVGGTIILGRKPDLPEIDSFIRKYKVTYLIFPPTLFIALSQFFTEPYPSVRNCISFGAFLGKQQVAAVSKLFPNAEWRNYYGQTESTPMGTTLQPEHFKSKGESIGKPHINVEIRLVGDDGAPVSKTGEIGEIQLRGPTVAAGYYNNPEKTAETFLKDGWLRTGDLAKFDSDGFLYFVDRKKDIVRTGGENVSTMEVEGAILEDARTAEAAVIGIPHKYWGEAVTAFVTLRKEQKVDEAELLSNLNKRLAAYKIPKKIIIVDALPHNPSGKILKKELREKYSGIYA